MGCTAILVLASLVCQSRSFHFSPSATQQWSLTGLSRAGCCSETFCMPPRWNRSARGKCLRLLCRAGDRPVGGQEHGLTTRLDRAVNFESMVRTHLLLAEAVSCLCPLRPDHSRRALSCRSGQTYCVLSCGSPLKALEWCNHQVAQERFALAAKLRDKKGQQREADAVLATYKQIQEAVDNEDFEEAVRLGPALARQILVQSQNPPPQRRLLVLLRSSEAGSGVSGGRQAGTPPAPASLVTLSEFGKHELDMLAAAYRLVSLAPDSVAWSPSGHFVAVVARHIGDDKSYLLITSAADGHLMARLRLSSSSQDAAPAPVGQDDLKVASLQWSPCGRYLTWLQSLDGQRALMAHAFAPTASPQWGGPRTRPIVLASKLSYSHVNDLMGKVVAAVECEAETVLSLVDADPQAEVEGVTSWLPLISPGVQSLRLHCPVAVSRQQGLPLPAKEVLCVEMVREDAAAPRYLAAAAPDAAANHSSSVSPTLEWIPRVRVLCAVCAARETPWARHASARAEL